MQSEIPFYYNTNLLRDPDLQTKIKKCKGQEKDVYEFFFSNIGTGFCWSEVKEKIGIDINSCSLKRAITNLKIKQFLIKTDQKVKSSDGGISHRYTFNKELLINNLPE